MLLLIFLRLFTNDAEKLVGLAITNKHILSSLTSKGKLSNENESSQIESLLMYFVKFGFIKSLNVLLDDDELDDDDDDDEKPKLDETKLLFEFTLFMLQVV